MEKKVKVCRNCWGGNIGKKYAESDFDMRFEEGHELAGIDTCLDCGSDDIYTVKNLLDKAREEGREELLDSIITGIEQLKSIVMMFNPISTEIRAKQSGEIEAYDGLLEKLSKLRQ
jgi:hypothetical protein